MIGWLNPLWGAGYQFWSGIGSGSPLLAGVVVFWRRHNCHERWCPRIIFREHPDSTGHLVCRKHFPAPPR